MTTEDTPATTVLAGNRQTPTGLLRKLVLFPLTRLVIAGVLLAAAFILRDVIANGLLALPRDAAALRGLVLILAVSVAYVGHVRLIERREVRELAIRKAPWELGLGMAVGAGVITATVVMLWMLGSYRVIGMTSWSILIVPLVATAATAFWEEIAFRGVVFRILEEGLGTWGALAISAALFGLLHFGNENASLFGTVTITATAGIFLAGVYILTRRLWFSIGAHYAVNLTQGPVLGLPVSGRERTGLLQSALDGPDLLTGGAYGIEASLITAAIGLAVASYVVWRGYVKGRFVGPLWTRRQDLPHGGILSDLR
ncbi:MAG: CPBP family intramembrane glutamic endopeptidase [Luteimonas sp.]